MVQQQQLDNMTRFDGISEGPTPINQNSNSINESTDDINQNVLPVINNKQPLGLQTVLPSGATSCTESHYNADPVSNSVTPRVPDDFQISDQDLKLNAHKDAIYKSVFIEKFTLA